MSVKLGGEIRAGAGFSRLRGAAGRLARRVFGGFDSPFRELERITPRTLKMVRLEADSRCQLQCPLCPTGLGMTRETDVGWGRLTFDRFKGFIDSNANIRRIELSNYGEIFLNPELDRIAEYACSRGVVLSAQNGVNLNTARDSALEAVVRYPFETITVSIDGASEETYAKYRLGGSFERVMANVRKLVEYKRRYGSELPHLRWQFVIFGHNEYELEKAWKMATDLGMTFVPKMNYGPSYSPLRDEGRVRAVLARIDGSTAASLEERFVADNHNLGFCSQVWESPQINWDGTLLGCCVNYKIGLGNVFESGLETALESPRYRKMKRVLHGQEEAGPDGPCASCVIYKEHLYPRYRKRLIAQRAVRRLLHPFQEDWRHAKPRHA